MSKDEIILQLSYSWDSIYLVILEPGPRYQDWLDVVTQLRWIPSQTTRGLGWLDVDATKGIPTHIIGCKYDLKTVEAEQYDLWEYIDHIARCLEHSGLEYQQESNNKWNYKTS